MTAFNRSTDLPADVDRANELLVWNIQLLDYLYPDLEYLVNPNPVPGAVSRGRAVVWDIQSLPQGGKYFMFSGMIPMDPGFVSDRTAKLYTFAQDFGTAPIPAGFKVA